MKEGKRIIVIGAGFAGLSAATCLAHMGHQVVIIEKNDQPGGRARTFAKDGFLFDMGPSWYWMPDVFEDYFGLFGKKVSDYYPLKRLDPSYRVYFGKNDFVDMPAEPEALEALFESIEPGSANGLREFLAQAKYKYEVGMGDYVHRPCHSITEFIDLRLIRESFRIQMFTSLSRHAKSYFKSDRILKIIEFPVLFLGATAKDTPAMYSLMNYADMALGTWYPEGGMNAIVKAMVELAREKGVDIRLNQPVTRIVAKSGRASGVLCGDEFLESDFIVAACDYHHADQFLLGGEFSNYSKKYWGSRILSPSSLLVFLGVSKKLTGLPHHSLFFHQDFSRHANQIYKNPQWPDKPLFYVCATSASDPAVAPPGCENLFFLMPLAPGIEDPESRREEYLERMIGAFEELTGFGIKDSIMVKRTYCVSDFTEDYNSFKGNAYGLANRLLQTAFLKPAMRSKKVENLLFCGQLTVPGPGVPPSLISGQIAAKEAGRWLEKA